MKTIAPKNVTNNPNAPEAHEVNAMFAAMQIVDQLDDAAYASILLVDPFNTLYTAFMLRFPNFKGKITVVEKDMARIRRLNIEGNFSVVRDFLAKDFADECFDLVLMHPPYELQSEMYEKAIKLAPVVGNVQYGSTNAYF